MANANTVGYGNSDVKIEKADDGGHIINHTDGEWHFCDYFYGGHPYSGQEMVYKNGKPVWAMQYRGWVHDTQITPSNMYSFLKKALLQAPKEHPYRGPAEYTQNTLTYRNVWDGNMENFNGVELILDGGQEVYKGLYFGGMVDE